jgi:chromosome segregation ATPase
MQFFSSLKEQFSMSRKEMCKYIDDLVSTNYELVVENNNFKNDYLSTENQLLQEKLNELDSLCNNLTQDNDRSDKEIKWIETENKNLRENLSYLTKEVDRQENEILDLYDKNEKLETENTYLKNYNKMLENANFNLKLTKDILETKVEDLSQQKEINEILETDKPLSSNELLVGKIDKLEEKNDTYKEVVKAICNKYDIPKESVIEIIETVQSNKSQQLEKTL